MGTSKTTPLWAVEIMLMETFGWTERQLNEEVSLGTIQRILFFLDLRAKAQELLSKKRK